MIGYHFNRINILESAKEINKNGGKLIQIFLNVTDNTDKYIKSLKEFSNYLLENKMECYVHSGYINNLCRNWDEYSYWIKNIEIELRLSSMIHAKGLIIHFGKSLSLPIEQAINNMYSCLLKIHNETLKYDDVKICLETPAGQGTEICGKLLDLAKFMNKFYKMNSPSFNNRFRICVDTCHIHAYGYDMSNETTQKEYFEEFNNLIGLDKIELVHLNDCYGVVGCKVDRHARLGEGTIGNNIINIYHFFENKHINMIIETGNNDGKEIKFIRNEK